MIFRPSSQTLDPYFKNQQRKERVRPYQPGKLLRILPRQLVRQPATVSHLSGEALRMDQFVSLVHALGTRHLICAKN